MATVSSRPQKIVVLGDPKFVEVCVHMPGPLYEQHIKLHAEVLRAHCKDWKFCSHYSTLPDIRPKTIWKGIYCEYIRLALSVVFECDAYKWCDVQTHCVLHNLFWLAEHHICKDWESLIIHVHAKGRDFFVSSAMIEFVNAARKKKLSAVHSTKLYDDLRTRQKELDSAGYRARVILSPPDTPVFHEYS